MMQALAISDNKRRRRLNNVDRELRFTEAFDKHEQDTLWVRELECLRVLEHRLLERHDTGRTQAGRRHGRHL